MGALTRGEIRNLAVAVALAQGIAALLDDPERRSRMGRIGRERMRDQLSWGRSVESLASAYRRARPRPAG